MKRFLSIPAVLAVGVLLCGATTDHLPPEVASDVKKMADFCRENNGKPRPSGIYEPFEGRSKFHPRKLVEHGFLAGSGSEVWAIDAGRYRCDPAAGLFSGSGGSQVAIFVRLNNGRVEKKFTHGAYGLSVTRSGPNTVFWLRVGGPMCGQEGEHSHGDSILCDRPIAWNEATENMDFAPIAEARFPFELNTHR